MTKPREASVTPPRDDGSTDGACEMGEAAAETARLEETGAEEPPDPAEQALSTRADPRHPTISAHQRALPDG